MISALADGLVPRTIEGGFSCIFVAAMPNSSANGLSEWLGIDTEIFYHPSRLPDTISSFNATAALNQAEFSATVAGFIYRHTQDLKCECLPHLNHARAPLLRFRCSCAGFSAISASCAQTVRASMAASSTSASRSKLRAICLSAAAWPRRPSSWHVAYTCFCSGDTRADSSISSPHSSP